MSLDRIPAEKREKVGNRHGTHRNIEANTWEIFRVSTMDDKNAVSELNVVDLASMYGKCDRENGCSRSKCGLPTTLWKFNIAIEKCPFIVDLPIKIVMFQLMSWLVVWNMNFIFPCVGNNIIRTDFHIFQRGGSTTNQ